MIRLVKGEEPAVLQENRDEWRTELLTLVENGEPIPEHIGTRYNHPQVKEALRQECFSKCMYCESRIGHIAHEHIEHFRPKARERYPQFTYEWVNLGLACPKCNGNKGDRFDEDLPFINPYEEDPDEHFVAAGALIFHRPGDRRAELTEQTLALNRLELVEERLERITAVRQLADRYASEENGALREVLADQIAAETQEDRPYCMSVRSVIELIA